MEAPQPLIAFLSINRCVWGDPHDIGCPHLLETSTNEWIDDTHAGVHEISSISRGNRQTVDEGRRRDEAILDWHGFPGCAKTPTHAASQPRLELAADSGWKFFSSGGGYFPAGTGWYRKTFHAPSEWNGKRVSVEFDGVYRDAAVYLNGRKLGNQPYGYTSFPGAGTAAERQEHQIDWWERSPR